MTTECRLPAQCSKDAIEAVPQVNSKGFAMQHALLFTRTVLGAGICTTLRGIPDWTTWHETTRCPEQMVDLAERCCPAVTLFDMTCLDALDLFQTLGQARVKRFGMIVVATMFGLDEEVLFSLAMWGVAAHISGDTEPGELADILQRVTHGEYLLTEECLKKERIPALRLHNVPLLIEEPLVLTRNASSADAEASPLTEREAEVLCCIAQGMTNREVARTLGISEQTIKNHVSMIFEKLQVRDRTSAVVCAIRRNWIPVPEVPLLRRPAAAVA